MLNALLGADISGPKVVYGAAAVGILLFIILFMRPSGRWTLRALSGIGVGVLFGAILLWLMVDVWDVFKVPIKFGMRFWFIGAFAALGLAVVSFSGSRRWRKWLAALSIPAFLLVAGTGINAEFGLNRNLGALLGISTAENMALPQQAKKSGADEKVPLWKSWKPPSDMPVTGLQGVQQIPNTKSGFVARAAGIYLPPAARTANPPRLPLVIMLMGQPGNPDTSFIGAVLDKYAAAHNGLAPIVVVADQIGPDQKDTLCLDTQAYGNVETYLMKDVVDFAKKNLSILQDPKFWTIAGYSNGGQCAISLAAKYPQVFGNVLDISGEEFPGAENPGATLAEIFNGDQAAYDAQKPLNIMAGKHFKDHTAIFTVGSDDPFYVAAATKVAAGAQAAGMNTTYFEVLNGGHVIGALNGGLEKGFEVLYPRLGLSH